MMTTYELVEKNAGARSCELSNALVGQKNAVLTALGAAGDAIALAPVLKTLKLLAPVWKAADYGYKAVEVCRSIIEKTRDQRHDAERARDGSTKRSQVYRFWDVEAARLLTVEVEALQFQATL